jgi:tRNA pseudouridine55 synthase
MTTKPKGPPEGPPEGLLLVDKPAGWTSHDVVARIRRVCGTRRVGHAGTLDPMATGVLVLGVGRATKLLTFLVGCDKGYAATVRLGETTITDDAEGDVVTSADAGGVTRAALDAAVGELTGAIQQVPSSVSAIKIDGRRSYARVRSGEDVQLAARPVTVSRFAVTDVRPAGTCLDVDIEVEVSSGTYVRALARDLGSALGVGGHLTALRRTRVGRFAIVDAVPLEGLEPGGPVPLVGMGVAAEAQFALHRLTAQEAVAVGHGRRIPAAGEGEPVVAALAPDGSLVAMLDESGPEARPIVVFAAS